MYPSEYANIVPEHIVPESDGWLLLNSINSLFIGRLKWNFLDK